MTAAPTPQERRLMFGGCCEHSDLWHDGHGCLCCDCKTRRMTAAPTSLRDQIATAVRNYGWAQNHEELPPTPGEVADEILALLTTESAVSDWGWVKKGNDWLSVPAAPTGPEPRTDAAVEG